MRWTALLSLAGLAAAAAFGQTSANFKLEEYTFNNGGNPAPELSSASFRLTIDALGDGITARGQMSGSFALDGGFLPAYPPPGEVITLRFTDADTLGWTPEPSVGAYNLYRGDLGSFAGYGVCLQGAIPGTAWDDSAVPGAGSGYFYLVTASNRLAEEGTKGWSSGGMERENPSPCGATACDPPCTGGRICQDGACVCPTGQDWCPSGGSCVSSCASCAGAPYACASVRTCMGNCFQSCPGTLDCAALNQCVVTCGACTGNPLTCTHPDSRLCVSQCTNVTCPLPGNCS